MIPQKDRIESAIRHIQTSADVDQWAMELAVDALKAQEKKPVKLSTVCLLCKKPAVTFSTDDDIPYTNYSYCEDCLRKGLKLLKAQDVPDTNVGDMISRQAAIARAVPLNLFGREVMIVSVSELENLPSAQPEPCEDAVSRQYILDALAEYIEEYKEVDEEGNYDPKWCAMKEAEMVVKEAPSAQPEIIRCKDCKYWHREIHNGIEYFNFSSCDLNHYGDGHNFYCADAERRTDDGE